MEHTLSTTIKDKQFDKTFVEVPCEGSLDGRDNNQLRLFRLRSVIDKTFDMEALRRFISVNVGNYIFTRTKIQKYIDDDEREMIGLDAVDELRKNRKADVRDTGTEIGEVMLYIFLEAVLKAPKLYSKVELAPGRSGKDSIADGIHILLTENDGNKISYEMVFGSSSVIWDLGDAIDDAFNRVAKIKAHARKEIALVEESVFNMPYNAPEVPFLEEIINNPNKLKISKNTAYGIFLGFSLGLDKSRRDDEYLEYIDSKINDEIMHFLPQIKQKIADLGLTDRSFYIYVFPFDNAEEDKKAVMRSVMKEGELYE